MSFSTLILYFQVCHSHAVTKVAPFCLGCECGALQCSQSSGEGGLMVGLGIFVVFCNLKASMTLEM